MLQNKNKAFILFVAAFMVMRLILMYLYTAIFDGNAYQFSVYNDVMMPLLMAAIIGYVFIYRKK